MCNFLKLPRFLAIKLRTLSLAINCSEKTSISNYPLEERRRKTVSLFVKLSLQFQFVEIGAQVKKKQLNKVEIETVKLREALVGTA